MPTTTILLPNALYKAGERNITAVSIPTGITGFKLVCNGTTLTSTTLRVSILAERSMDGGATWEGGGGVGFAGGVIDPDTGLLQAEVGFHVDLPQPDNPTRRLRGTITMNEDVITLVSITTFP
jgi:hypothetical protein